jgi:hypothetical protein
LQTIVASNKAKVVHLHGDQKAKHPRSLAHLRAVSGG